MLQEQNYLSQSSRYFFTQYDKKEKALQPAYVSLLIIPNTCLFVVNREPSGVV